LLLGRRVDVSGPRGCSGPGCFVILVRYARRKTVIIGNLAKRRTAQQPRMMRSCHLVPGVEGMLERFSAMRRIIVSGSFESWGQFCQKGRQSLVIMSTAADLDIKQDPERSGFRLRNVFQELVESRHRLSWLS